MRELTQHCHNIPDHNNIVCNFEGRFKFGKLFNATCFFYILSVSVIGFFKGTTYFWTVSTHTLFFTRQRIAIYLSIIFCLNF